MIKGPWGWHLIVDAADCDRSLITMKTHIENFAKTMVKEIDMVAYGDPIIEHFADHDEDKAGFTLVQLIETSNITAHFCNKSGDAYIDVFSCKPFSSMVAMDVIQNFFHPKATVSRVIHRDAKLAKPKSEVCDNE